jgi:ubiquinone/menaquinone biosynthesis C-methylase UbiE
MAHRGVWGGECQPDEETDRMGRFATTVPFYARYREPYPKAFFSQVAASLGLTGKEELIDVGCGPAPLAIGFAPFVAACTGIDPEPGMISAAQAAALEAGVRLKLIEARVEELPETIGTFDLAVIGRALHWMQPAPTLRTLERLVKKGGAVALCGSSQSDADVNCWAKPYQEIRRRWSLQNDQRRYRMNLDSWFAGSRFHRSGKIAANERHEISIDDLIGRAYSRSTTSPAVIGDRRTAFEAEIIEAVQPFAENGILQEEISAHATIFR